MALKNLFTGQQWRNRHREQTCGEGGEDEMYGKSNMETCITMCNIDSQREFAVWLRKLKQGLCIHLEGVGWGGRWEGRSRWKWSRSVKLTLCNPMDQGSSVHGFFQARVLEWVAISLSRGSSQPRDQTQVFTIWATREVQKGGDICIPMADLCWGLTENSKILQSNYHSIKKIKLLKIKKKTGELEMRENDSIYIYIDRYIHIHIYTQIHTYIL